MTNRFDTPKAALRAEPRPFAPAIQQVPATPGGLIRSTLLAAGAAGAILILFWLPAEYGIDPTGVGHLTGLTEMGEIKQQLAAEAEADAQAAAVPPAAAPVPTVATPELLARLDRIDAQLAVITAALGASESPSGPAAAAQSPSETAPDPVEAATPEWRDEVSYTLNPGEVNFDLHGDGGGQSVSYEQGRAVPEMSGDLVAAFTGNHGWFWRNRTEAPVTVTLRTAGEYQALRAP